LGFYEGNLCYPEPLTWLDRLVVQLSDALVIYSSDVKGNKEISYNSTDEEETTKNAFSDGEAIIDTR
jgi:hypothetical protein